MEQVEKIIISELEPEKTNVGWYQPSTKKTKFFVNGAWQEPADKDSQADWNEESSTSPAYIKNKPTIPAAQIQSDWNQSDDTAADYIKNKPTIPSSGALIVHGTLNSSGFVRNEGEPEMAELVEYILSGRMVLFSADSYLYSFGGIYYYDNTPYIWLLSDNDGALERLDFNDY